MTNGSFDRLFGGPPRAPDALLEQRHMDLAASVQAVTDEAVVRMVRSLVAETGLRKLQPILPRSRCPRLLEPQRADCHFEN